MDQNSGIPVTFGGVVIVDSEGRETRYTPEEWRHKQVMEKLDNIERRLELLEQLQRISGTAGQSAREDRP